MSTRHSSIAFIAGVLICAAILMLWARSYFFADSVAYNTLKSTHSIGFLSTRGSIHFGFSTISSPRIRVVPDGFYWSSFYQRRSWSYVTVQSLLDFRYNDMVTPVTFFSGPIRSRELIVPQWAILLLAALFPAWILFRRDPQKARWKFRTDITWRNPRLRARILRFAIFSIAGIILGTVVGWADIKTQFTEDQAGWLMFLLVLLPVVSLMAVFTRRRIRWNRAILWMALELAGCVCFFESTLDFIWRRNHINRFDDVQILQMILYMGLACFIFGAILLLFLQVKPEPPKPGPYCPECGYCLIGSPRKICSECGRPFTLEELKITPEDLAPLPP